VEAELLAGQAGDGQAGDGQAGDGQAGDGQARDGQAQVGRARAGQARAWLWGTVALSAGAFAGAVVLAPPASAAPIRGLAWLLFLGSSVHVAATGWLYTLPDVRAHVTARPLRYVWIPAGLVVTGAVTAAAASPAAMAWLLLAYFAWQFFHFQKQNLGLAALAASIHRVRPLSRAERRALMGAGGAGILGLLAHPGLLQLRVRPGAGGLFIVAGLLFAAGAGFGVVALVRRPAADRPAGFCVMYLMALLFSLPIFVFRSPYAAVGGMTIGHGFQYLLLVGLVAAGNRRGTSRWLRLAGFANVALVGGALLSGASHLHGFPPAIRLVFGAYLGVVTAHFVIDAGFWRMRDPFPRAFLARHVPGLAPPRAAAPPAAAPPATAPPVVAPAAAARAVSPAADGSLDDIGWPSWRRRRSQGMRKAPPSRSPASAATPGRRP
jgi:hypothetical protein